MRLRELKNDLDQFYCKWGEGGNPTFRDITNCNRYNPDGIIVVAGIVGIVVGIVVWIVGIVVGMRIIWIICK